MLKFGNKEFRNLQEQVKKNMDDIMFILQEEGVLNEFGIKVVGQEDSALDMPTVEDYKEDNPDWAYGDAYAIGTEAPYELYVLTRANGSHPDDYWFNIGEFPAPGPEGPEGPQGEQGVQGQTGPSGQDGITPVIVMQSPSVTTLSAGSDATASVIVGGTIAQPTYKFEFGIPRGADGSTPTSIPWGNITGSIADQTDLVSALQGKANVSALSSYATKIYADNVANNAEYQAVSTIRTSDNEFSGSAIFYNEVVFGSYIYKGQSNFIDYPIELPSGSGTLALTRDIPSLSGYATEAWVSANFLSADTPIGGSAEWGSISGTLTNQTDLMSKFSEYALLSDIPSLSGYATEAWVVSQNYASQTWVNNQISGIDYASVGALSSSTQIPSDTSDLTNNAGYITSSALSSYATVSQLSSYATEVYVQNSLSDYALASELSLYALSSSLSLYATVSAVSSAISGVESTISSLDYASVGALSSATVIPEVSGTNDGTNWTSITINEDTYDIPSGGPSGDYVPVQVSEEDSGITQTGEITNSTGAVTLTIDYTDENDDTQNKQTYLSIYQDDTYLGHDYKGTIETTVENPDYDPEDPESEETVTGYETVDLGTHLYIGADSAEIHNTVIEDNEVNEYTYDLINTCQTVDVIASDYASQGYVYGSNDGQYWTDLTIGSNTYSLYAGGGQAQAEWGQIGGSLSSQTDLMSKFSEYAQLSASNTFTKNNTFQSYIYVGNSSNYIELAGQGTTPDTSGSYFRISASSRLNLNVNVAQLGTASAIRFGLYSGTSSYGYVYIPTVSGTHTVAFKDDIPSVSGYAELSVANTFTANQTFSTINTRNIRPNSTNIFTIGATNLRYSTAYINTLNGSDGVDRAVSQLASVGDIPTISGYAELSASNTFTGDNTFNGSLYASNITLAEDGLTSTGCYLSGTASGMNSCSIRLLAGYGDMMSAGTAGIGLTVSPLGTAVSLHANQINLGYPSSIYISGNAYEAEVWTFTLSDNTSVSKTILVG